MMDRDKIIEALRDDSNYYGDLGKQFLSNSNIGSLLTDPSTFNKFESAVALLEGGLFHYVILEPEKVETVKYIDASSRNTKLYKDATDGDLVLLKKEYDNIISLADRMKSNPIMNDLIYNDLNVFEEPNLVELFGYTWKCKADILSPEAILDVKTTSDISKFKRSASMYNYDSQAYIYREAFGRPFCFLVICKKTGLMKVFECSDEFYSRGEEKVYDAIQQYERFFGLEAEEDVNNFVNFDTL